MDRDVSVLFSVFETDHNLSAHLLSDSQKRFQSARTVCFQPSVLARVLSSLSFGRIFRNLPKLRVRFAFYEDNYFS